VRGDGIDQTFADINKLPKLEMAPPSGDPATIPWPDGDLVEKKPLLDGVNQAALEAAGEWTFDRSGMVATKGKSPSASSWCTAETLRRLLHSWN